jgi:hypothetical protein
MLNCPGVLGPRFAGFFFLFALLVDEIMVDARLSPSVRSASREGDAPQCCSHDISGARTGHPVILKIHCCEIMVIFLHPFVAHGSWPFSRDRGRKKVFISATKKMELFGMTGCPARMMELFGMMELVVVSWGMSGDNISEQFSTLAFLVFFRARKGHFFRLSSRQTVHESCLLKGTQKVIVLASGNA